MYMCMFVLYGTARTKNKSLLRSLKICEAFALLILVLILTYTAVPYRLPSERVLGAWATMA